ncbi:MAG: hypothetical protein KBS61_08940 [Chryseobacterium sp.]|nr:hypothetical protein [Candidatus Chryseobacterium enterohippi]
MKKIAFLGIFLATQVVFAQNVSNVEVIKPKQSAENFEFSSKQKKLFDKQFFRFLEALKKNDSEAMNQLLSPKVKGLLSDEMIARLKAQIDTSKKLESFKTRKETLIDQESYPVIEYKYTDDKSDNPKKTISVFFEKEGQIMGIKPSK